jgi:hydroxymethylbilane synthase
VERDGQLWLRGLVGDPDGGRLLCAQAHAPLDQCEALGREVAAQLIAQGAAQILQNVGEGGG